MSYFHFYLRHLTYIKGIFNLEGIFKDKNEIFLNAISLLVHLEANRVVFFFFCELNYFIKDFFFEWVNEGQHRHQRVTIFLGI